MDTSETKVSISPQGGVIFEHKCAKCDKWGSFGYNVNLRNKKRGVWYCLEHKPKD